MDDDTLALPNHVTRRGRTFHYVRRIPDDIASAFRQARIQLSLKTTDPLIARQRALDLDKQYEAQFAVARRSQGNASYRALHRWLL
jgi:hypothetical protein